MDLRPTDQVIVVTGAASGIGQATARLLSEERYVRLRTGDGRHGCCHDDRRSSRWGREFEEDSVLALGYVERRA